MQNIVPHSWQMGDCNTQAATTIGPIGLRFSQLRVPKLKQFQWVSFAVDMVVSLCPQAACLLGWLERPQKAPGSLMTWGIMRRSALDALPRS